MVLWHNTKVRHCDRTWTLDGHIYLVLRTM